jgi:Ti-type conjugative transfer relaxase TraA
LKWRGRLEYSSSPEAERKREPNGALIRHCATSRKGTASSRLVDRVAFHRLAPGIAVAIYHLTAKIVSRARGQSVVAAAAYRAGEALHDERYGLTHDYGRKVGVEHSEILAPAVAPAWVYDRAELWNHVEAHEVRKDAQLAREVELALPVELTHTENGELVRDYVRSQFVSQGMVADFSIHEDDRDNPHAHVLLTLRPILQDGFGPKERRWNATENLLVWREAWASHMNQHLARAGHAIRVDHRTLEAQGNPLEPGRKIGVGQERQREAALPRHIAERVAESGRIARENGEAILADPTLALKALTHTRATFTRNDIAKYLHTRTDGAEQFERALLKVTTSSELVELGRDDNRRVRFTTREMLEAETALLHRVQVMSPRRGHGVEVNRAEAVLATSVLTAEQRNAFGHLVGEGDVKALVGVAGAGKSTLLETARRAWEGEGYRVLGAALSGIAAQNLESASGIQARTLASLEWAWGQGREALTKNDVLVIDEAGMIGTRQLERVLAAADKARAKVVLVGDPEQLQAIEAGAAFRGIVGQIGMAEMQEVRRQRDAWAREATQALATARTGEALNAYEAHGAVRGFAKGEDAQRALLESWQADRLAEPHRSQLILAYTREEVRELNGKVRDLRAARGELGEATALTTSRGERMFAANDRIMFLRNERSLGVKNGSLGTLERIQGDVLEIRLDASEETRVLVDTKFYNDLDWGYASTVHKSQGSTVDRSYVLASRYFDRHTTYVALSRHREAARLFYAEEEFTVGRGGQMKPGAARERLQAVLSRARPKELAHDFLEHEAEGVLVPGRRPQTLADMQAHAAERWLEARARSLLEAEHGASLAQGQAHSLDRGLEDDFHL